MNAWRLGYPYASTKIVVALNNCCATINKTNPGAGMDILPLFVDHYIKTLLWSTSGENSEDLSGYKLSESAKMEIAEECQQFIFDNIENIKKAEAIYGLQMVAHDFCLTRNGHGAGFWDGDLPSELGEALTKATDAFEQQDAYVGDDGLVYV